MASGDDKIRKQVEQLRTIYSHLIICGAIGVGAVFIWALSGAGYFWPIWLIIGMIIGVALEAMELGLLPLLRKRLPIYQDEWEKAEMKRLKEDDKPAPAAKKAPAKKKVAPAKKKTTTAAKPKAKK